MNQELFMRAKKALEAHRFTVHTCKTGAEAAQLALSLIPEEHVVSWGGTTTIDQIGLKDLVKARGNAVIDRDTAQSPAERVELMRKALLCDTFLTSANAISADGVLVNIDGNGNRVAAMCYGPKSVIVVAGANKLCESVAEAQDRVRNVASPKNALRLGKTTPCALLGRCADCQGVDSMCTYFVNTRFSVPAGRIQVILVEEELGF